jgi:hypothetical protein
LKATARLSRSHDNLLKNAFEPSMTSYLQTTANVIIVDKTPTDEHVSTPVIYSHTELHVDEVPKPGRYYRLKDSNSNLDEREKTTSSSIVFDNILMFVSSRYGDYREKYVRTADSSLPIGS